jgi:hypothetical protein
MKFAEHKYGNVMNPSIGTEFDNCDEAYEYYNIYSWECGFGIRWGKKRWSEKKRMLVLITSPTNCRRIFTAAAV